MEVRDGGQPDLIPALGEFKSRFHGRLLRAVEGDVVLSGERIPLLMEMPPYRMPHWPSVLRMMWRRSKSFLREAGTVILLTDGYENAGSITIEASPGSATNTFDAVRGVGALSGANLKIGPRVFALGVGGTVQSDRLEILASGGHYAQISEPDEIPPPTVTSRPW